MTPLRTIHLAGYPLRIYASPRTGPDYPWASFKDFAALAGLDADHCLDKLKRDASDLLYEPLGGPVLIAESIIGGLFLAWVMLGVQCAQALLGQWERARTDLFVLQHADKSRAELVRLSREAGSRNVPFVLGETMIQY